ncbi:FtsW/RodA/SpoVE family cell cycle protein [Micrococcales bacterium 31B]|nr:FtsW/RodA/SpoVE family cell cycle protein [Micrococcales bacterium 31B]
MATVMTYAARPRRGSELLLLLFSVLLVTLANTLVGVTPDSPFVFDWKFGLAVLVFALALHLVVRWKATYADPVILPITIFLNGMGYVVIHRVDLARQANISSDVATYAERQLLWIAVGVVMASLVLWFMRDHRILRRYTWVAAATGALLLLLPLVPGLGLEVLGARIWIAIGPFSIQPSEFAKIALAIFFAGYLVINRDALALAGPKIGRLHLPRWRDLGPILCVWALSVMVLVFETDLGTSLLFFGLFVVMIYLATERTSWIIIGLTLFAAAAVTLAPKIARVNVRVTGWLNALDADVYSRESGNSYQLVQGLFGLANGGLTGTGLSAGRPDIVPFAWSDFVLSSYGELLGLSGMFVLFIVYLVLVQRGMRAAIAVPDTFGKLLAGGFSFAIALQCFVVAGGVLRVIPLTGLTLPFMASGGSSIIANWIIIGILLRISDAARRPATKAQATEVISS